MEKIIRNNRLSGRCPFMQKPPSNDCYCVDEIDNLFMDGTIHFCTGNFLECKIYRSLLSKRMKLNSSPYEQNRIDIDNRR
ncbi:MAG TPA: hypothetical protein ACFYDZ_05670 [Candidatus Brocadiaceae bacterium]